MKKEDEEEPSKVSNDFNQFNANFLIPLTFSFSEYAWVTH